MTQADRERGWERAARSRGGAFKMHRWISPEGGQAISLATPRPSTSGNLTFDGDYATLSYERRLKHPVQAVWEALTDPDHLAQWYMTKARMDPREGGSIDYVQGPVDLHVTGKILIWDPPRVFEHEWNVEPRKGIPNGERSVVRWELIPEGDTTFLRFSHRRLTRQTAIVFSGGMPAFLERLENLLDGVPLVDWFARVEKARVQHPDWGT